MQRAPSLSQSSRNQQTIGRSVSVSGFGYWSGLDIEIEFRPAPVDHGWAFVRTDLPNQPKIQVHANNRVDALRRTTLEANSASVEMIEHICAALMGLQIDNCEIRVDRAEMPGSDGSSWEFVGALLEAGVVKQAQPRNVLTIHETVRVGDAKCWIEARPDSTPGLTVSYELNYENCAAIGHQFFELTLTPNRFVKELAPARTFLLEHEAQWLRQQGLGARVSYQQLLVFGPEGPIDNQLRFEDECVRHKALDVVGDLALAGCDIQGRIIACRSGHQLNAELVQALLDSAASRASRRRSA